MSHSGGFPFQRLQLLALRHLGIRPDEFWNLTPRELIPLLRAVLPPPAPDHDTLRDLMRRYGD